MLQLNIRKYLKALRLKKTHRPHQSSSFNNKNDREQKYSNKTLPSRKDNEAALSKNNLVSIHNGKALSK